MDRNTVIAKTITNTNIFRTLLNFWRAGLLVGVVILFNRVLTGFYQGFNMGFSKVLTELFCRVLSVVAGDLREQKQCYWENNHEHKPFQNPVKFLVGETSRGSCDFI